MTERRIVRALDSVDSVAIDDVIQLDMAHPLGPVLCIVTTVSPWGVVCYAFAPRSPVDPFHRRWGHVPLRVERGHYERVGRAVWVAQ